MPTEITIGTRDHRTRQLHPEKRRQEFEKKTRKDSTSSPTSSELIGHTNQIRKRKPHFN